MLVTMLLSAENIWMARKWPEYYFL